MPVRARKRQTSLHFKMLGIQVDTSRAQQGKIAVGHTAERKLELGQAFEETLAGKEVVYETSGEVAGAHGFL